MIAGQHDAFRKINFRPNPRPHIQIPLGARSAGHYRVTSDLREPPLAKDFIQVFWSAEGEGIAKMHALRKTIAPGDAFLYFPGDVHDLEPSQAAPWEYFWLTIDGVLSLPIVRSLGFKSGMVYRAGLPQQSLFEDLFKSLSDLSHSGEFSASSLTYQLLLTLRMKCEARGMFAIGAGRKSCDRISAALKIIHDSFRNSRFGISELADAVSMNRATLSRQFRATVGLPPIEYLRKLRIQTALSELKSSSSPVREVALSCGWSDLNYFSRCVRSVTGLSPVKFRES